MATLTKISSEIHPLITHPITESLHKNNIVTIIDFLNLPPENLIKITKLTFKDILLIKKNIVKHRGPNTFNGREYYESLIANTALLSTGIEKLDKLLEGGIFTGNIYEIFGLSGSGKSQLCLSLTINVIQKFNQHVFYVDTKRDFSTIRISQILLAKGDKNKAIGDVFRHIYLQMINDVHELIAILDYLLRPSEHKKNIRLIVIDMLPSVILSLSDEDKRHGFLNVVANKLKRLVKERHMAVVLVNCITGDNIEPAMGKFWQHIPNTRILLESIEKTEGRRAVKIFKSTNLREGSQAEIQISKRGLS